MNTLNSAINSALSDKKKGKDYANNRRRDYVLHKKHNSVSFKGFNPVNILRKSVNLDTIAKHGTNPIVAPLVSSAGILAVRPAITMMDKQTPKKDRLYSASWQAAVAISGLAAMMAFGEKIKKASEFLTDKIMGGVLNNADKILSSKHSGVAEAVLKDSGNEKSAIKNIIKMSSEQVDELVEEYGKTYSKRTKTTFKSVLCSFNFFRKAKDVPHPFETNPGLIREIYDQYNKPAGKAGNVVKGLVDDLVKNPGSAKNRAGKILARTGMSKAINFVTLMTALTGATYLVTRYLDKMMNFTGKLLNIDALKNKTEKNKEEDSAQKAENSEKTDKEKWNELDKTIFTGLGAIAVIEGANIAGAAIGKKNIGYQAVAGIFKGAKKVFDETAGRALKAVNAGGFLKSAAEKARNSGRFGNILGKAKDSANVNDKWIERSVVFNLFARLAINLPTGQYYNATRDAVDQTMILGLAGMAEKTLINPAKKGLAKLFGVKEYNPGINVIADQGIKNVMIIGVLMGFLNNAVSGRFVKMLEKTGLSKSKAKDKEESYQEHRRRFIAAHNLDKLNSGKQFHSLGSTAINNPFSSDVEANKNTQLFAEILKDYQEYKKRA